MLAVWGLRREEMGNLEAARLLDGYVRRKRWEFEEQAAAMWGMLSRAMGKTKEVPGYEMMKRFGVKL